MLHTRVNFKENIHKINCGKEVTLSLLTIQGVWVDISPRIIFQFLYGLEYQHLVNIEEIDHSKDARL